MEMPAHGAQGIQQTTGDHRRKALDRVEPGRGERAFLRAHAVGGQHQQRQHRHGLAEHVEQLQHVEVVADPLGGQLRATDTGQRQHPQTGRQHPAAVHCADVAQRRHQRQRDQLRHRHQQHQRAGLRRTIALDLSQIRRRNADGRRQHDEHAGQGHQGETQVAPAEHAQLEERQRLGPFVEHEQHQQQHTAAQQPADQQRVEPAPAVAQAQAQHQRTDGRQAEQHATPVELTEALQAQRVLRQAPADAEHRQRRRQDDLPERPLPADVLGPQPGQRRTQVGAEGGGQGVAGQAIDLDAGRQEAQGHAHQHRWQRAGGQALQHPQHHQAVQVGGVGLDQAKHREQADGAEGEAAQGKGGRQPRRKGHGRHGGRGIDRHQPGAFIGADGHGATDIGQRDLGDHLVEPGAEHRQQHAEQPDHHPQAEGLLRGRGGRRCGGGRRSKGRGEGRHQ